PGMNGLAAVLLISREVSKEMPSRGLGRATGKCGRTKNTSDSANHEEEPLKQSHCVRTLPIIYPVAVHFWDSARRDGELDEHRRRGLECRHELVSKSGSGDWRHSDNHERWQLHGKRGWQFLFSGQCSTRWWRGKPGLGVVWQSIQLQWNN